MQKSLVGKIGYALRDIPKGQTVGSAVRIGDLVFKAMALEPIKKNQEIKVVEQDGDKLIVIRAYIEQDLMRDVWLYDGSYTERWEQGFRRKLYHGRTGAYFASESAQNIPFDKWTLPEIIENINPVEPYPWNNALRMRNSKDGATIDHIYVGFPKALYRGVMAFEAKLPSPTGLNNLYIGFEVNSGGKYANMACLACINGAWKLYTKNFMQVPEEGQLGSEVSQPVTISRLDAWGEYALVYDPPFLLLYEYQPATDEWKLIGNLYTKALQGKAIPFFANEMTTGISEFLIGNVWIYEIEPAKHTIPIIDVASLAAGGEVHADLNLALLKSIALTIKVTYGSTATAGVRVYLLASANNIDFDSENTTDAFTYFEPSFSAGATRQKTVNIDSLPKYLRVLVRNLDTANAQGAVKVYMHAAERL